LLERLAFLFSSLHSWDLVAHESGLFGQLFIEELVNVYRLCGWVVKRLDDSRLD
jgi:hypothetical protein